MIEDMRKEINKEIIKNLKYPLFLLIIACMLILFTNYIIIPELSKYSDINSVASMGQYIFNDITGSKL